MKFTRQIEIEEDMVAAMLLEMDKEEAERIEVSIRRMRLEKAGLQKSKSTTTKHSQPEEEARVTESTPTSPSEIAAAILQQKNPQWLRRKFASSHSAGHG
jgi:hypothetical protein